MSIGAAQHRKRCSRTTAVKITSNSRKVHSFGGVSRESSEISGLANDGPLPWQFPTIPMRLSSRKHRVSARGGWPPLLTVPLTDSGRQLKSYWWRKWPPRFGFGPRMFRASLSSALRRPSATSGSIIAALFPPAGNRSKGLWRLDADDWTLWRHGPRAAYPIAPRPSSTSARFWANPWMLQG
jgi:hypothetical protein